MAGLFQPKRVQVPGLLSDDGLAAALKEFSATTKQTAQSAPPNTSAVDASDRVLTEALKAEPGLRQVSSRSPQGPATLKLSPQAKTSNPTIGLEGLSNAASEIVKAGTLTPDQQVDEQQKIIDEAKAQEKAVGDTVTLRDDIASIIDEGRTSEGLMASQTELATIRAGQSAQEAGKAAAFVKEAETTLPTQTWWLNAAQVSARSAAQIGVNTLRFPGDVWDTAVALSKGEDQVTKSDYSVWADGVDKALTNMLPGDKARSKQFVSELAAGGGSMVGFLIAGFAGRVVGLPAALTTGTLGAAVEGDSLYQEADGFSANATQKMIALVLGAGLGVTEAIPIDRAFMRADAASGGAIRNLLANTTASSLEEFIQEASQTLGEDIVAKYGAAYDPTREISADEILKNGVIGAITGGAVGGATTLLSGGQEVDAVQMDEAKQTEVVDAALAEEDVRFAAILGDELDGEGAVETPAPGASGEAPAGGEAAAARPDPVAVPDKPRGDAVQEIVKPTNVAAPEEALSKAAQRTVETPEFKTFFEGSKVVDEAGVPQIVYHATTVHRSGREPEAPALEGLSGGDFAAFKTTSELGAHFGTVEQAEDRVTENSGEIGGGARVFPVYLNIKNPLRVQDAGVFDALELLDQPAVVAAIGADSAAAVAALLPPGGKRSSRAADRALKEALKAAGHDGLVYLNRAESVREAQDALSSRGLKPNQMTDAEFAAEVPGVADSYLAFEPTQIKSAIANSGAFDPTNPNIDQQVADPITAAVNGATPEQSELAPLPNIEKGLTGPIPMVVKAARAYAAAVGLPLRRQREYVKVDTARAARIAQAYADMKHEPQDPAVLAAYTAMAEETVAQYQFVKATGLVIEPIPKGAPNPYEAGPRLVLADIARGHMWYFRTEDGFGSNEEFDPSQNPLLEATSEKDAAGNTMLVNDVFRVVHDFFGHGMEGSGFGARGEENAWQSHMRLFSASAVPAMTSETRGQNSWVNYGPFGAANRANPKNTTYADQKTGIMPSWTWQEGIDDSQAYVVSAPVETADAVAFHGALSAAVAESKYGAVVKVYSPAKYAKMRLFLSPDGNSGFALDGETLVSVFGRGGGKLRKIVDAAVANGARKLDAFDTGLPQMYASLGWRETGRRKWNDKYAPKDWPYDELGRPDVVDMEYDGDIEQSVAMFATSAEPFLEWDDGAAIRGKRNYRGDLVGEPGGDGDPVILYSGAPHNLRVASRAMWLTPDRRTAEQFGDAGMEGGPLARDAEFDEEGNNIGGAVFSFYARMENPLEFDWEGNSWNQGPQTEYPTYYTVNYSGDGRFPFGLDGRYESEEDAQAAIDDYVEERRARIETDDVDNADPIFGVVDLSVPTLGRVEFRIVHRDTGALLVDAIGSREELDALLADFKAEALDDLENFSIDSETDYEIEEGQTTDGEVAYAERNGYDGVIFRNVDEGNGPVDVYVVLKPGNAKSTANLGSFDKDNPDILRMTGTSTVRQPYVAEPTRPTKGIPSPTPALPNQEDVRLSKISSNFVKVLDLTARHGRLATKGSATMGEYNRRTATIRLRTWTDFSTLVHEGGHALNDSMAAPLDAFVQRNQGDIIRASKLYAGDLSQAPITTVRREGFAEFFRAYVTNPPYARRHWPAMTADFEATVKAADPKVLDGLNSISAQFAAWVQLPSRQLIRNMVVDGRRESGIDAAVKELRDKGFKGWMAEYARRATGVMLNKYVSVAELEAQLLNLGEQNRGQAIDLKRSESPTAILRLARNGGSRAQVQITDGVIGYRSTQSMSRGLREALMTALNIDPATTPGSLDEELMKDFDAYIVARRAFDEFRRFDAGEIERPPIGAQKGDVMRTIKEYEKEQPQFIPAAQIVHEYGMAMWQKRFDAGLMDKETYEEGLQRQFYAPLQRDVSDKQGNGSDSISFGGSVLTKGPRFRGSDRDIISPMTVLMQMTFALEKQISENDAKRALAVLADRAGQAGALVERIPASQLIGQSFTVQQVAARLTADAGLTAADASDLMTILAGSIDKGDLMTLFRSEQAGTQGENVLFFWENGKIAAIRLNDTSLASDVVNTMNAVGRENMDVLLEAVAATSTVFRTAITSWPDFLLVNYIRDQMSAWVLGGTGYVPFVSGIQGIADEIRQKQWAKSYNAAGGTLGGMTVASLHQARVDRDIGALRAKGYTANLFGEMNGGWSNIPGAIKGLARFTAITETGTRLGLYRGAYNRAIRDGLSEYDASIEAAYTATDYIDFGLNGSKMLHARRLVPFLNAQLQGLYKMYRTLGGDEVARRKGLRFALGAYFKNINNLPLSRLEKQQLRTGRTAWLKMMALGLIGAALWAVFRDDPDYQEVSEYVRVTHWVIPTGDGKIIAIPKPFELAIVSNAVERGLEFATGDTTAMDRFMRGVGLTMIPPTAPPAIQSVVEVAANYDFFTGRAIVPDHMQALAPQLQYDNYTSSLAKWVGGVTGQSPMVVDHVMGGLGASAYRDITTMLNAADPSRPMPAETDWPILRRFVRDVRRGSASAQDFWKQASTTNGALERAAKTYDRYKEMGNEPAANRFLDALTADQRAYAVLMTDFKADAKRLSPFYRARQVGTIVSGMRRENGSALGLGDTTNKLLPGEAPATFQLTRGLRTEVDTLLSEIARREVRNTMIATGQPGWAGKEVLPLQPTLDLLLTVSPDAYDEYQRRLKKSKVYDADTVFEYWPDIRDRLVTDGPDAILSDAVAVAGVVF